MPKSDEEAKAKLIEYIEKGKREADTSADSLQDKANEAKDTLKGNLDRTEAALDDAAQSARQAGEEATNTVQHYSEVADQKAGEVLHTVKASANNAQLAFDDSLSAASTAVKSGAAQARFQYSRAYQRSQEIWDTAVAHSQSGMDTVIDTLKDGVKVMQDHEKTSAAVGLAAALIILPGPRRLLWRQTIGRLQSEEGMFKSAELKATHLKQNVSSHTAEAQKLGERLTAAQTQYSAGLAKMIATNRQLQSLQSTVAKTEQGASSLIETLRELPSSQALKLRAEVAMQLAAAKAQRIALERQCYKLSKKGF